MLGPAAYGKSNKIKLIFIRTKKTDLFTSCSLLQIQINTINAIVIPPPGNLVRSNVKWMSDLSKQNQ